MVIKIYKKGHIMFKYFMIFLLFAAVSFAAVAGCSLKDKSTKTSSMKQEKTTEMIDSMTNTNNSKLETAVLGAGCFWCVEAIFQDLKGVERVESGYSGGTVKNPTYKEVCSGTTGHAEVVKITFDPSVISYEQILTVFFHVHDPTTLNRQGADAGTQYRSAIFYNNDEQKKTAEKVKEEITNQKLWDDPIVTEITAASDYYSAEDYHQNYFNDNPNASYCSYVIAPKVKKFYKEFGHLLKEGAGK
jgi:peptide-methionine (S)-S-oxide reductase